MASKANRAMDEAMYKNVTHSIEKEAKLRTLWFQKNEERLNEIANKVPTRKVPQELKDSLKQEQISSFQRVEKHPKIKTFDVIPNPEGELCGIMRPVDPTVLKLIYTGSNKDGRMNYLKQRYKLIPEDRFYFTEVTSFEYGWKFREMMKNIKEKRYGRSQIIQETFYRRRGAERDPNWYKEPAVACPTFCNTAAIR